MKNKKVIILVSAIVVLLACIIVIMTRSKNDIEAKERMIKRQIRTNDTVMVYNEIVIDNHRLDSYTVEDEKSYKKVGYAHFILNEKNNYELVEVIDADKITRITDDIMVYEFLEMKVEGFSTTLNFVISNDPQLAKVERVIENGETQIKEVTTNPAICFFDDLDHPVRSEYIFHDKDGNIIK